MGRGINPFCDNTGNAGLDVDLELSVDDLSCNLDRLVVKLGPTSLTGNPDHGKNLHSKMLHGAGIFTDIWVVLGVNVGKYSSTMECLGFVL